MAELFANNFATTLAAAIVSTSATTLTTASAAPAALQGGEFRFIIDSEIGRCLSGQSGTTWTVERGIEGSVAATHLISAPVVHVLTVESLSLAVPRPGWVPVDNGYLASNFDPGDTRSQVSGVNGEILWAKLAVPQRVTITNLVVLVGSPGASFSAGNFGMLFSSTGTLVAKTASQSTNWATAQAWPMALTAEAGQTLTRGGPGHYVIAAVMSRAATPPIFKSNLMEETLNLNLTGLGLRSGSDASDLARTTAPASISAGSQTATIQQIWFGLS